MTRPMVNTPLTRPMNAAAPSGPSLHLPFALLSTALALVIPTLKRFLWQRQNAN